MIDWNNLFVIIFACGLITICWFFMMHELLDRGFNYEFIDFEPLARRFADEENYELKYGQRKED